MTKIITKDKNGNMYIDDLDDDNWGCLIASIPILIIAGILKAIYDYRYEIARFLGITALIIAVIVGIIIVINHQEKKEKMERAIAEKAARDKQIARENFDRIWNTEILQEIYRPTINNLPISTKPMGALVEYKTRKVISRSDILK